MATTSQPSATPAPTPEPTPEPPVPPPSKRLLLAVITHDKPEASLGFLVALLKFQVAISATDLLTDMHHFRCVDDALNAFATSEHGHLFIADAFVTFDPDMVLSAVASPHDAVVGCYPMPGHDWARVKAAFVPNETDPKLLATTHNVEFDNEEEYALVTSAKSLAALYLSRRAVARLAAVAPRHDKGWLMFAPGIHDGQLETPEARLARMLRPAVDLRVDLARLCGNFGSTVFAGCIAHRTQIR